MQKLFRLIALRRPQSVFRFFLVSYLLILLIPIVLGGISYTKSSGVLKEQMGYYNVSMLDQTRQVFDTYMYGIDQLMTNLTLDPTVRDFLYVKHPMSPPELYAMSRTIRGISKYTNTNEFISGLFIYFRGSDAILTPTAKYAAEAFFAQEAGYWGGNVDDFIRTLGQPHSKRLQPVAGEAGEGGGKKYVMYMQSLPINEKVQPLGTAVIVVDRHKFEALLKNVDMLEQGAAYVIDGDGRMILSVGNRNMLTRDLNPPADKPFYYTRLNGQDVIVSHSQSSINQWKYVSIVPTSLFLKKVNDIKTITWFITLAELVLGGLLSIYLARKNYIPIKRLADKLGRKVSPEFTSIKNELALIERAAEAAVGENEKIRGILRQQKPIMRMTVLNQLLNGSEKTAARMHDSLDQLGIVLNGRYFCAVCLQIGDCGKRLADDNYEQRSIIKFVIINAVEELLNQSYTAYGFETGWDEISVIVNAAEKPPQFVEHMYRMLQRMKQFIEQKFHTVLTVGIGEMHEGIDGLTRSGGEAKKALEYKMVKGKGSIIAIHELHAQASPLLTYPLNAEAQILRSVKTGDISRVNELLDELFAKHGGEGCASLEAAKGVFMHLVSTGLKVLGDMNVDYNRVFGSNFQPVAKILDCSTVIEIQTTLKMIFAEICLYISQNKKSHNEELKEKILAYIHANLRNANLSLTSVASYLHMNASYLSAFFKEQTGENFVDYLTKARLEMVKELLQSSSLPLTEICGRTGYSSSASLIRVFKKLYGITPGQYRESVSKG